MFLIPLIWGFGRGRFGVLAFGLTISNAIQFLSQPKELHVKLNILIANFFNLGQSSPYESHHLADTYMNYNVLVLRI